MMDKYNLNRFIIAQEHFYKFAIYELENGKKRSHWIWFIFPQLKDLGFSSKSKFYGITCKEEAKEYINNSILGKRYIECCNILLNLNEENIIKIMGEIDAMKLKSSLTLFKEVDITNNKLYCDLLEKYFGGEQCIKTINILSIN